jgi:beta-fructofuranosidase
VSLRAAGTFAASVAGKMPATCKINATIQFEENTKECGLMLRCSDDMDKAYYIRLEPKENRLVFDMWPRNRSEVFSMIELSRHIKLAPDTPVSMEVLIEGNKGVAYVNNTVAMNFRAYDLPEGNWGVFVMQGNASFRDMSIATL